ncbi:hypothetical protein D3C78_445620 [compost metagenome]
MFIEHRLLDKVAYGTQAGLEYRTDVKALRNGAELRSRLWAQPLAKFTVIYRALLPTDREAVVRAFRAAGGRHLGFRMRDPLDYLATDEPLGVATGEEQTVQLTKLYPFGPVTEIAHIKKPVTVTLKANGVLLPAGAIDLTTGLVTFTADAGQVITWTGEFDKPVRFDDDVLMWTLDAREGATGNRVASTDVTLTEFRL